MAHQVVVADEQYVFLSKTRNQLFLLIGVGVLFLIIGLFMAINEPKHEGGEHHGAVDKTEMVATVQHGSTDTEHQQAAPTEHGSPTWLKRLYTTLWMNNVYFAGMGIIGLFFVAIQYVSQAGWSAGLLRIPMAMGRWIPIAGIIMLVLWFITHHDIFHWTHADLYSGPDKDAIISKKAPFFFFPLAAGTFPLFFIFRMVLFFGMWYWFYTLIRRNMLAEDLEGSVTTYWYKNRTISTWFLLFFAVSSSVAAWDWVMSIDTHWFSTMFGWYMFASWWVTALAVIALIAANLKSAGYLKVVNSNHLHDIGKFVFGFTIFWTYIWFSQFMLIYYANIPEETVYFIERMSTSPYSWIFYANLILNFVLPFLLLMTRDAKRQISTLKLVTPIIIVGHWFDFFNMITPGVMHEHGGIGFMEIGTALIFAGFYLFVVLSGLTRMPLIGKNHPMLEESLHHHI